MIPSWMSERARMKYFGSFLRVKMSRVITFLLFGSLKSGRNYLGSYISPSEKSASEEILLSDDALKIVNFLKVVELDGSTVASFGSAQDGGYVLINDIVPNSIVISGGIETNNDFEYQLGSLGCKVIQIDYSVNEAPLKHENLEFLQKRIVASSKDPSEIDLDSLVNDHFDDFESKKNRKILKLDIEGSEWEALSNFKSIHLFDQIVLELHYFQRCLDEKFRKQVLEVLERINATHQSIQLSGNNCCGFTILGGVPIPNVIEVTFASRERYSFKKGDCLNETGLSTRANYPQRAPLYLGGFH
jgi:hypothetical protein